MRVTDLMMGSMLTSDLQSTQAQLLQVQEELASGNQINQPSDNPIGTEQVMHLQTALAENKQYSANAQSALSWLQSSQAALSQAVQAAQQVRTLALEGATGTTTAQGLSSLAAQAKQLLSSLVDTGNTQFAGLYMFNGEETDTAPFTLAGGAVKTNYGANATQVVAQEIGPGVTVTLNPGTDMPSGNVFQFQAAGGSTGGLLPAVQQIVTDLSSGGNPAQLDGSDLTALDSALTAVENAQGETGAVMQRVQLAQGQLSQQQTTLQSLQGSIQSVNMAQATVQLQELQSAYQAALAVGAKLITPTLASYLP